MEREQKYVGVKEGDSERGNIIDHVECLEN